MEWNINQISHLKNILKLKIKKYLKFEHKFGEANALHLTMGEGVWGEGGGWCNQIKL